jgi:anhydro-N-acetylmuramic acid kinase
MSNNMIKVIGLMSGTSCDGIDASVITTNGHEILEYHDNIYIPYNEEFKKKLHNIWNHSNHDILMIEQEFTLLNVEICQELMRNNDNISLIGFHGHTVKHLPEKQLTWQIGNGALLAAKTNIPVIYDFRRKDIALGGQGAPLVPLFHQAIFKGLPKPIAVVNIGGVSNVTWIGDNKILAFDAGAGNVIIDHLAKYFFAQDYDEDGKIAAQGKVNKQILDELLMDSFFHKQVPKSLDRDYFNYDKLLELSPYDAIATATEFTVQSILMAQNLFPQNIKSLIICGGGRQNCYLINSLKSSIDVNIILIDELGFDGNFIESQAFAYLAARSYYKMPISLPSTTGVLLPSCGGSLI